MFTKYMEGIVVFFGYMDTNFKGSKDQRINRPPKAAAKGSTGRRRRRPKDQQAAKGGGQRISKLYKTASKDQSAANGQRINDPAARPRYLSLYIVVFLDRWIVIPKDQRINRPPKAAAKGSTGRVKGSICWQWSKVQ